MATLSLRGHSKWFLKHRHVYGVWDGMVFSRNSTCLFSLDASLRSVRVRVRWVLWTDATSLNGSPLTPAQSVQQQSHQPVGIWIQNRRANTLLPDRLNAVCNITDNTTTLIHKLVHFFPAYTVYIGSILTGFNKWATWNTLHRQHVCTLHVK